MDIGDLEATLSNAKCSADIMDQSFDGIDRDKDAVLASVVEDSDVKNRILLKLKDYRCAHELDEIEYGSYIRWLKVNKDGECSLTNGGFVAEIKITLNGPAIVCKAHGPRLFQCNYNDTLVFKKLTRHETIILQALELAKRLPSE